jgi:hypothetical protein
LHVAAERASLEADQWLVAKCPITLQVRDDDGWLPLHVAAHCSAAYLDVAYCLLGSFPSTHLPEDSRLEG